MHGTCLLKRASHTRKPDFPCLCYVNHDKKKTPSFQYRSRCLRERNFLKLLFFFSLLSKICNVWKYVGL